MSFFPWLDSSNGGDGASRWDTFSTSVVSGQSPTGRSVYRNGSRRLSVPASSSLVVGWKCRFSQLNSATSISNYRPFRVYSDAFATTHLDVLPHTDGAIRVLRGGNTTPIAQSDPGVVTADAWHDYEVHVEIADSGGRVRVWVDGASVIDFTGDTRNGGTSTDIDGLEWGPNFPGNMDCSDHVVDATDQPKGPTMVWSSLPSGAGSNTDLAQGAGSGANWERVDEATPDGDTSYVFGDTEGQKDTYAVADLPSGSWDVLAVQVSVNSKKADSGIRFMRPLVRTGGTDFAGDSVPQAESYTTIRHVWESNPDTSAAWAQAEVDALEVGAEIRDS